LSWGGVGNIYRNNTLRDGPHTAALGGGNDNVFEGNLFEMTNYETDDGGSWYSGRSWAHRNNTLVNNVFKRVKNLVPCHLGAPSVQAVYNDDMLSGNTFINNTFVDCQCGMFIGGGRHHTVKGNKFYNVTTPFHIDDRGLGWMQKVRRCSKYKLIQIYTNTDCCLPLSALGS
jgi:hypothetical protein